MLTKKELQEIEMRANAATPGPWEYYDNGFDGYICAPIGDIIAGGEPCEGRLEDDANTQFIAHARTDVPNLLKMVRELQTEIGLLKETLSATESDFINANGLFRKRV